MCEREIFLSLRVIPLTTILTNSYLRCLQMKAINEIFPLLDKPVNIAITTHQKPDADAMGSSLGLYNFLIQFGHQVSVISPTNCASWVNWMPCSNKDLD